MSKLMIVIYLIPPNSPTTHLIATFFLFPGTFSDLNRKRSVETKETGFMSA